MATRDSVLDAALSLFAEQGYVGTSIEDIGRAAKITGPAIYRHFTSKEQILIEAFRTVGRGLLDPADSVGTLAPLDAFTELIASYAATAVNRPEWVRIWLQERRNLPRRWADSTRDIHVNYLDLWTDVVNALRPDLERLKARELVYAVLGLLNGACFYRSKMAPDDRIALLAAAARNIVLCDAAP